MWLLSGIIRIRESCAKPAGDTIRAKIYNILDASFRNDIKIATSNSPIIPFNTVGVLSQKQFQQEIPNTL
jgi:hypothetical protein